jgi:DHA2 family methylenomycin A resistance protein-like MFS transporter
MRHIPSPETIGGCTARTIEQLQVARDQRLILAAASVSYIIVILDTSIVNVALKRIASDLSTDVAGLQWVVNAYTLTFASLLLTGGTLGDRWGIKRAYMLGLAVFTLASAVCGFSPSFATLMGGRIMQGIGAALLVPCSLALLHHAYPNFAERSKAISLWAGCGGVALAAGPLVGGLLIDAFDWRSIFLVNIPIGLIGIGLTLYSGEMQEQRSRRRLDLLGQVAAVVALGAFVATLIECPSHGATSPEIMTGWIVAALAAVIFLAVEARRQEPMLPLSFFRNPTFSGLAFVSVVGMLCFFGLLFVFSLYFQQERAYSPIETGLALLPFTVAVSAGNVLSGQLAKSFGAKSLIVVGSLVQIVGFLGMLPADGSTSYPALVFPLVAIGLGAGLRTPASATALMATVEKPRAGIASGVLNSSRQVGVAMGVAIFGALISGPHHMLGGMTICLWLAVGMTSIAVLVIARTPHGAPTGKAVVR